MLQVHGRGQNSDYGSELRRSEKRRLGLASACALIVGNMIGAGVFTTSGYALADLGRPEVVLLAWLVGGVLALCGALSYGALARRIPESGGEYTYLSRIVHPLAGFLAGWVSLLAGFTAPIAAAALALQAYLPHAFEMGLRPEWLGTLAILLAALMHGSRLREGVVLQNLAVGLKLVLIAALVGAGVAWLPSGGMPPQEPAGDVEIGAFAVTLVWISTAYSGWNAAVYVAGEVRDPERNLGRSLWLATGAVIVVYLSLNWVFLYSAPPAVLAGRPDIAAAAAEALGGTGLRRGVAALVALALFTSISTMVMAGPRVYARMAEDGLLPRFFGQGEDVPRAGIAFQAALAIGVVWISGLRALLSYVGFMLGLSAAATVAAMFVLRRREGAARVPVPGYPWVPSFFVLVTLSASGFMAVQEPREALLGVLTLVLGVALYRLVKKGDDMNEDDTPGLVARPPLLYLGSILVGLALQWLQPVAVVPAAWAALLGTPLIVAAAVGFLAAVRVFRRAGTPIRSVRPTTRIVQTGPYRFSRNPIYLAFTTLHLGIALWVNSAWLLGTLLLALVLMSYGVIVREERYLERKFGEEYVRYKAAVRRWF